METFLSYIIPTCLTSIILYGIYAIFLKNERFFNLLRFYLLFSIFFSFLLPFIRISLPEDNIPVFSGTISELMELTLPEFLMNGEKGGFSPMDIIGYIYWSGVIIFSLWFVIKIGRLLFFIFSSSGYQKLKIGRIRLIFTNTEHVPFSFFHYIVLNKNQFNEKEIHQIIIHEKAHITQRHSLDLLLAEVAGIFQWFNPVFHFYRKSLKNIHEYCADDSVLRQGVDKKQYLTLLISQTLGYNIHSLNHNFRDGSIKKRIKIMVCPKKKSKFAMAKILLFLPVTGFLIYSNNIMGLNISDITAGNGNIEKLTIPQNIHSSVEEKPDISIHNSLQDPSTSPLQAEANLLPENSEETGTIQEAEIPETFPEFPGGFEKLYEYLYQNMEYPLLAKEKQVSGKILFTFDIDEEGNIVNIRVRDSRLAGPEENAEEAGQECIEEGLRVIRNMPAWIPATQNGKPVKASFSIPINFSLD